ncbi:hypothetical protein [Cohnella sp. 56]|uniref:hypothetical protein n=1 Tax=Cohnella sp. 56 TaxID=3113722 RepID=UPI0030E8FDD2
MLRKDVLARASRADELNSCKYAGLKWCANRPSLIPANMQAFRPFGRKFSARRLKGCTDAGIRSAAGIRCLKRCTYAGFADDHDHVDTSTDDHAHADANTDYQCQCP